MLWIEAASVTVIVAVVLLLLVHQASRWDREQVRLHGMSFPEGPYGKLPYISWPI
jgi:hypothetical protein